MSPTPILDLEKDPPRSGQLRWIWLLVGGLIGAGLELLQNAGHVPPIGGEYFFPLLYLGIALHEGGHLLAGMAAGMKPGGVVIGGFIFFKSGRNWVFRFDARRIFGGGLAKPLPAAGDFRIAPFAWMVAGGPGANVLCACAALLWMRTEGESDLAGAFFWINLLIAFAALLPYSTDANKSDGARILLLLRRPAEARAWIALLHILRQEADGAKPREWDEELCGLAFNVSPGAREFSYVQMLAYYREVDLGNEEGSLSHLESCLSHCAKSGRALRQCFFLEASAASACVRSNPSTARVWLDRARKLRKPETTSGVDAGVAFAEKRYQDTLGFTADARAFYDRRKLDSGLARFARERLDLLDNKCRAALAEARVRAVVP